MTDLGSFSRPGKIESFFPEFLHLESANARVCPTAIVKWSSVYERPKETLRVSHEPVLPKLVAVDLTLLTGEVIRVRGQEAEILDQWLSARTSRIKLEDLSPTP